MQETNLGWYSKLHIGMVFLLFLVFFLLGKETVLGAEQTAAREIRTMEWGQNVSLQGLYDEESMYFYAGDWKVNAAEFIIKMNASQLLNEEVSYVTVYLNGLPAETFSIETENQNISTKKIVLPVSNLLTGSLNTISVKAYLRGKSADACMDDSSVSTWMNIFSDSKVELYYEPSIMTEDIAGFYQKFVSVEALDKKQSMIGVGAGADEAALTAMAYMVSGFGQGSQGDYEKIDTGMIRNEKKLQEYEYMIYIDRYEKLPDYLTALMSDLQKGYAQEGAGILLLDCAGTKVLLVTGTDDALLEKAGKILSNSDLVKTLTRAQVKVDSKTEYERNPYEWKEYISLTEQGVEIRGNFTHSAAFVIDYPGNRRLADSAELSLDFRYSENLDFDKSLLTVRINGIPIGSRVLTKEGAEASTEIFSVPADIDVAGGFTVETEFELYPKGNEWCELTPEDIPWAYISDTSMLKWTTKENTEVYFDYYPFPFVRDGEYSDVRILLPIKWSESDIRMMSGILLTMGKWVKSNGGSIQVLANYAPEDIENKNIISIGNTMKNRMDVKAFQSEGTVGGASLELSELGNTVHAVLTVTGEKDSGMLQMLQWLAKGDRLWELKGDLVYTDGQDVTCYYRKEPEKREPVLPLEEEVREETGNIGIVIIASVMILALLAGVMIVIKYGKK